MSKKRLGVIIGRFQPIHNSHAKLLDVAAQESDAVLVLVGSSNRAPDPKNPFNYDIRDRLIRAVMNNRGHNNFKVKQLNDHMYNDAAWLSEVYKLINDEKKTNFDTNDVDIVIYGHDKDASTYYLNSFPTFKFKEVGNLGDIDATRIREAYFEESDEGFDYVVDNTPSVVSDFLEQYRDKFDEYQTMKGEYDYLKDYKASWEDAPYVPMFLTSDALVYFKGHVLLVKRKAKPGYGLWALPGGYVHPNAWVNDAIVDNLKKETRIRVGEPILKSNIRKVAMFDDPNRSLRGRVVTQAGLIVLDGVSSLETLPKVRQGREIEHAKWFPVEEVMDMATDMFEDHYFIVKQLLRLS